MCLLRPQRAQKVRPEPSSRNAQCSRHTPSSGSRAPRRAVPPTANLLLRLEGGLRRRTTPAVCPKAWNGAPLAPKPPQTEAPRPQRRHCNSGCDLLEGGRGKPSLATRIDLSRPFRNACLRGQPYTRPSRMFDACPFVFGAADAPQGQTEERQAEVSRGVVMDEYRVVRHRAALKRLRHNTCWRKEVATSASMHVSAHTHALPQRNTTTPPRHHYITSPPDSTIQHTKPQRNTTH